MKIIAIVDIHGNNHPIEKIRDELESVDLVLIGGDLTHFGGGKEARELIESLRISNQNILAVTGNCDEKGVDEYLDKEKINIHGRAKKIDGINFIGAGGSLPCPKPTPNIYTEEEYQGIFESSLEKANKNVPTVMVSHQPPIDTSIDQLTNGDHVGSRTLRDFITRTKPLVCICGHIHEAAGLDEIDGTKLINPGPLGTGAYAYLEVTDKLDALEIREF